MSFLPECDRKYLEEKGITFEEAQDGNKKAVILKAVVLPTGRFDSAAADILILLPAAYPDVAPDMFYVVPWLKLAGIARYPNAADRPLTFTGQTWQRWSRHNPEWRPGVDGIWTMVKRIEHALAVAA